MMDRIEDGNAPKAPEIAITTSAVLAIGGAISGVLSIALHYALYRVAPGKSILGIERYVIPGLPFGLAAILPFRIVAKHDTRAR